MIDLLQSIAQNYWFLDEDGLKQFIHFNLIGKISGEM